MPAPAAMRGPWPGRPRLLAWSGILLAEEALALAAFALWSAGAFGPGRPPVVSDFVSFYGAGSLALAGMPALAYDQAALTAAEHAIAGPDRALNYFFYPPTFLLLCVALARLPYLLAYAAFQAAGAALWLAALRAVLADARPGWWLPFLAFPALWWSAALGQNAALTAALFGAGTLLIDRRPLLGGALLGLLCIKPHLGLLVPVALAAGGHWRGFAGAALAACALALASALAFGAQTWSAYLDAFVASDSVYATGRIAFAGFVTPFGAARLLGLAAGAAGAVQAAAALAAACFVAAVWRRRAALPLRATALIAGTLLAVPVLLIYDLLALTVAVAWLARTPAGRAWQRWALALPWGVAAFSLAAGLAFRIPLGPLAPLGVLAVCAARAFPARRAVLAGAACAGLALFAAPPPARAAWPAQDAQAPAALQCVAYARARANIDLAGDAWRWWDAAIGRYARGHAPAPGSVLSFRPSARIPLGHVAVVARVLGRRLILVDQANWSGPGTVSRGVAVADVSPANDWTLVRVHLGAGPGAGFGQDYPANGFIYAHPREGAPQVVDVAAALRSARDRAQVVDVAAALARR
ncbi:MAG: DUF2029 domain-containing protein [Proteobacteria bacterium]|nr:DUF2029 domain-containing protein [Pseudomonadota bacterium]